MFTEGLYVSTGTGNLYSDYEGPFSIEEAVGHVKRLCNIWTSPEILNSIVVVYFKDNIFDLAIDDDGDVINGKSICCKSKIIYKGSR